MSLKYENDDFPFEVDRDTAAKIAQAMFDDWLSVQVKVTGSITNCPIHAGERNFFFRSVPLKTDTHKGRLVCVEKIEKVESK